MGIIVTPGGSILYNQSANVSVKQVRTLDLNIPVAVRGVPFRMDSFTIRIEFTQHSVDQVILVFDLAKEISVTLNDVTINEWQSSLAIHNFSFQLLQTRTVSVQQPQVVLARLHRIIAD